MVLACEHGSANYKASPMSLDIDNTLHHRRWGSARGNKIGRHLFPFTNMNQFAKPLFGQLVIVELLKSTTIVISLEFFCELDTKLYFKSNIKRWPCSVIAAPNFMSSGFT